MPITRFPHVRALCAIAAILVPLACRGHDANRMDTSTAAAASSPGAVAMDTLAGRVSATTQAEGPGIQVTPTDQHSVTKALDVRFTNDIWARFMRAADSVAALARRDSAVRAYLSAQIVGSKDVDAGEKWLASNAAVSAAIATAGLTPQQYYRIGVATAAAEHYMADPRAAPPTPNGPENAKFVAARAADVQHLRSISAPLQGSSTDRAGPPSVIPAESSRGRP
ncbi:MAG TPA: hypothetical protein VJU87_08805 [Gemmatimonadaceae bacterium]|nr:hypothetical protein [Gemmatimonadaceae bacterium]